MDPSAPDFYFIFPRFKLLSGAERLILRLAATLGARGHRVTILCHQMHSSCRPLAEFPGVHVVESRKQLDRFRNRYLNAVFDYVSAFSLPRGIDDARAACVFFGPALPALWWARRIRWMTNPLFYFCYEPPRFLYRDREAILRRLGWASFAMQFAFGLYRILDRAFVRAPDVVLTQGEFGKGEIRRIYGRDAAILPHGAELAFTERPARETFTVLTVNYLHPRKRVDLFLATILELRASQKNLRAVVVGDGPERSELERLAIEMGLADCVRFAGFVEDSRLPADYAAADAYLHTAKLESFGLSVLDALASGLAVVSVDEGGPAEMIEDGVSGFLCAADPGALVQPLRRLADDPALRARIGRAASAKALARFSWEAGAAALLRIAADRNEPRR